MMKRETRVRTAIIGDTNRGGYGHHLATAAAAMPELEIVAVSDPDPDGRAMAQASTRAPHAYPDFREMLSQETPELVMICPRWVDQRVEHVRAATAANAHVFIEKPLAATVYEADLIAAMCADRTRKIAVAHQARVHPASLHVRHLVNDGYIGRLRLARGFGKMDHRGGMQDLHILGTHIIDLLRWIAGDPEWVKGELYQGGRLAKSTDAREGSEGIGEICGDALRWTFGLPDDVLGSFESYAGLGSGDDIFGIDLVGESGQLSLRGGLTRRLYSYPRPYVVPGASFDAWAPVSVPGAEPGDMPGTHDLTDRQLFERANQLLLRDLLAAIEEDRAPVTCGIDAVRNVETIQGGVLSHITGQAIDLPLTNWATPSLGHTPRLGQ